MSSYKPSVGDLVTVTEEREGYGSNYGSRRGLHFALRPGMRGVIGAVDVPCVFRARSGDPLHFNCIDWHCEETGLVERCAAYDEQIVLVKAQDPTAVLNLGERWRA